MAQHSQTFPVRQYFLESWRNNVKEETFKVTVKLERTVLSCIAVAQLVVTSTAPARNFSFHLGDFWEIGLAKAKRAGQRRRLCGELLHPQVGSYGNLPRTYAVAVSVKYYKASLILSQEYFAIFSFSR